MRASYMYEADLEHHADRVQSDPHGHRVRLERGRTVRHQQDFPDKRLMQVLSRSNPARVEDNIQPTTPRRSNDYESTESRDSVWNAFTEFYPGEEVQSSTRDPRNNDRYFQMEEACLDRYAEQFKVEQCRDDSVEQRYQKNRRVKFAEKLEIDTKLPPTPKTPTRPILRKGGSSTRNNLNLDSLDILRDLNEFQQDHHGRRDPTPVGANSLRLDRSDPPTDGSESLLYSLSSSPSQVHSNRRPKADRRTGPSVRADARSRLDIQTSLEPVGTEPLDDCYTPSTIADWDVAQLFPFNRTNTSRDEDNQTRGYIQRNYEEGTQVRRNLQRPPDEDTGIRRPIQRTPEEKNPTRRGPQRNRVTAQPVRIPTEIVYSPTNDRWDNPDYVPRTDSARHSEISEPTVDLSDAWRMVSPSRSDVSNESQSAYLIRKYTTHSQVPQPKSQTPGTAAVRLPRLGEKVQSKKRPAGALSGPRKSPRTSRQNGRYSNLDDGERLAEGTELMLRPGRSPRVVLRGDDNNSVHSSHSSTHKKMHDSKGKRRSSTSKWKLKSPISALAYPDPPVVTVSNDETEVEESDDEKMSASDPKMFYNRSNWDAFDNYSDKSPREYDQLGLLPKSGISKTRSRRMKIVMFTMVLASVALALAIYFKIHQNKNQDEDRTSEDKASSLTCVTADREDEEIFSDRYLRLRHYLVATSVGDSSSLDVPESPQRKSLCWISDTDEMKLSLYDSSITALIQRYTLGVLYYSFLGKESNASPSLKSTDFLSSEHECNWDIVMCNSSNESVTALLLADKGLSGTLPPEIGNLNDLSFLELSLNRLTGTIPSSIGELIMLEYFGLAFNMFTGTLPSELGELTNLEFINMRSSQVQGEIPSELGSLSGLEMLLLEGNWLSGSIPTELGNLINAEQISFQRNHISGLVPNEICELRNGVLDELKVDSWVECSCCTP